MTQLVNSPSSLPSLDAVMERLIDVALSEDLGSGDITTSACLPPAAYASAQLVLKQAGVVAGLPLLQPFFQRLSPHISITTAVPEGSYHKAGTILAKFSGPAAALLSGRRTLLNMLQHISGIATMTHHYVKKIAGLPCVILASRKTLPGLRALEYYAVSAGGGSHHRLGLYDCAVIKTEHLSFLKGSSRHPIRDAIENIRATYPGIPVEVEIEKQSDLDEALTSDVDAIILANMSPAVVREAVIRIRPTGKKIYLESRGLIDLATVRSYAETGVDGITIGAVTYSAGALDIHLRISP